MADVKIDMLRSYIRGALSLEAAADDRFMLGYEAGLRAIRDFLDAMERPIEDVSKKIEDSQFSLLT